MKFILIITMITGSIHSGPALTTAEFDSKDACQRAGEEWASQFVVTNGKYFICVSKSGEK